MNVKNELEMHKKKQYVKANKHFAVEIELRIKLYKHIRKI